MTIPKILMTRGYATGRVGKWHLGSMHGDHAYVFYQVPVNAMDRLADFQVLAKKP